MERVLYVDSKTAEIVGASVPPAELAQAVEAVAGLRERAAEVKAAVFPLYRTAFGPKTALENYVQTEKGAIRLALAMSESEFLRSFKVEEI